MNDSVQRLTIQFLEWVSSAPRTYAEAMETWKSTCPRVSIFEDALADGLIRIEHGATVEASRIAVTSRGREMLSSP